MSGKHNGFKIVSIAMLNWRKSCICGNAARALGVVESEDAVFALIQLLQQDQNVGIRSATAKALKSMGISKRLKSVKQYESR